METRFHSYRWDGRVVGIHHEIALDRMVFPEPGKRNYVGLMKQDYIDIDS